MVQQFMKIHGLFFNNDTSQWGELFAEKATSSQSNMGMGDPVEILRFTIQMKVKSGNWPGMIDTVLHVRK